jgi:hypothetical protein
MAVSLFSAPYMRCKTSLKLDIVWYNNNYVYFVVKNLSLLRLNNE